MRRSISTSFSDQGSPRSPFLFAITQPPTEGESRSTIGTSAGSRSGTRTASSGPRCRLGRCAEGGSAFGRHEVAHAVFTLDGPLAEADAGADDQRAQDNVIGDVRPLDQALLR